MIIILRLSFTPHHIPAAAVAMASSSSFAPSPAISHHKHARNRSPSLFKFLQSDLAHEYLLVASLFAQAYTPYLLPPCLLLAASLVVYRVGFERVLLLCQDADSMAALLVASVAVVAIFLVKFFKLRSPPCYLVDFASFKSLDERKMTTEYCEHISKASNKHTQKSILFQLKVLLKSGLGEETYGPEFVFKENRVPSLTAAREEMDHMMFGALDELFNKTGLTASQVDYLIVNVSMFYPSPSLASHLVNHYKMREDVKSYNISGMGCAAGMVALDMAKDILRIHKNKYAVIVGTENITLNWYYGNDRSMLVPNCLFRCGSYALLLSNKGADKGRSKFELLQSIRTTTAASDKSYDVIVTREDDTGIVGTSLSAKLLDVASQALRISITKLVPSMMPASELLKVAMNTAQRSVLKQSVKPYMPDFKRAFTHFCIHPGGRAVIDGIGKNLKLTDYDLEPARMTLHRFGNTSSSGLWYAMAYCEAKERLKKGDKVWQVALGSGFKCNSVVWKVLRDIYPKSGCNPWMDCIHRYPVDIPDAILPTHPHYKMLKKMELQVAEEEKLQQNQNQQQQQL